MRGRRPNPGFRRHRRSGTCVATFPAFEADLLRSLAGQLIELLRNDEPETEYGDPLENMLDFSGPTKAPEDPVLARLLPSAYDDDDEASADFRRFTETSLRESKVTNAREVIDSLTEAGLPDEPEEGLFVDLELDQGRTMAWMRCLTDMRLAIATRLGIEDDDEERWEQLPEDDPTTQVHRVYLWLGFLQETLVEAAAG